MVHSTNEAREKNVQEYFELRAMIDRLLPTLSARRLHQLLAKLHELTPPIYQAAALAAKEMENLCVNFSEHDTFARSPTCGAVVGDELWFGFAHATIYSSTTYGVQRLSIFGTPLGWLFLPNDEPFAVNRVVPHGSLVWFACHNGVACFDQETGQWRYTPKQVPLLADVHVSQIVVGANAIVIASNRGLVQYNPKTDTFTPIEPWSATASQENTTDLCIDADGRPWQTVDERHGGLRLFDEPIVRRFGRLVYPLRVVHLGNGVMAVGSNGGVGIVHPEMLPEPLRFDAPGQVFAMAALELEHVTILFFSANQHLFFTYYLKNPDSFWSAKADERELTYSFPYLTDTIPVSINTNGRYIYELIFREYDLLIIADGIYRISLLPILQAFKQ